MLAEFITKKSRRYLVGKAQEFSFRAVDSITLLPLKKTDLYIHIPFCKNMCPYCPYNKIKYDSSLAQPYLNALLSEIRQYHDLTGKIEATSIYFGGGTPTNLVKELGVILKTTGDLFNITGDICIETGPGDVDKDTVSMLAAYGVGLVSLGVQSFNDRYLQFLGRNYKSDIINPALDQLLSAGFKSVNLDLMFALPGQTVNDVLLDLQKAIDTGADQITTYPLFSFPYSTVGRYRKLKNVKMPNIVTRRKMYRAIHDFLCSRGFTRVSVWSFKRGNAPRYSSVTRDNYIGFGAGSGSHLPGCFYLNTFSVEEYIRVCLSGRLPVALKMDFTELMSVYYWLYWRFYDTYIPKEQLLELFGTGNSKLNRLLRLVRTLKLAEENEDWIALNERGAFWLHLAQNYFSLNYINKIWSVAKETPFPERINI